MVHHGDETSLGCHVALRFVDHDQTTLRIAETECLGATQAVTVVRSAG